MQQDSNGVQIREIQDKLLEILLYFQLFCQQNGLRFVLAGGTCLGAVRHSGFIPWDDDVDVFMLREDYERLPSLWAQNADTEHYACVRSDERINIHHSATEIKDNNTTFINRHSVDLDIHQGLMIDVIPLDAIPEGKAAGFRQMFHSMLFCCFNFQRLPEHKGKITYYATKLALSVFRSDHIRYKIWKRAERRMAKYPLEQCQTVASLVEGATIMRQHFPKSWFEHPQELLFEGHPMPVPDHVEDYLRISYGDYMQLPPEEEQIFRHNAVFIDLQHSYQQYKGIYYCNNRRP